MANKGKIKVSYQGGPGAFSDEAIRKYFGKRKVETIGVDTFEDVCIQLQKGKVDYGFLPIRNTIYGEMEENQKLISKYNLNIEKEYPFRVALCLICHPDFDLEDIKKVLAHPRAIPQCSKFLKRNNFKVFEYIDTALSAKFVVENRVLDTAGIASKLAAKMYGGKILAENIQNVEKNFTTLAVCTK